jgi:hypothetical protein
MAKHHDLQILELLRSEAKRDELAQASQCDVEKRCEQGGLQLERDETGDFM